MKLHYPALAFVCVAFACQKPKETGALQSAPTATPAPSPASPPTPANGGGQETAPVGSGGTGASVAPEKLQPPSSSVVTVGEEVSQAGKFDLRLPPVSSSQWTRSPLEAALEDCMNATFESIVLESGSGGITLRVGSDVETCMKGKAIVSAGGYRYSQSYSASFSCQGTDGSEYNGKRLVDPAIVDGVCQNAAQGELRYLVTIEAHENAANGSAERNYVRTRSLSSKDGSRPCTFSKQASGERTYLDCAWLDRADSATGNIFFSKVTGENAVSTTSGTPGTNTPVPSATPSTTETGLVGMDGKACPEPVAPSTAAPTAVVGSGTAASCTEEEFRTKAALGGRITFQCGANPHTITLTSVFQITLDTVLDGGGLVTLSGGGTTRVLKGRADKTLQLQNITIRDGMAADDGGAGVYVPWHGHFVAINTKFINNKNTGNSTERQAGALSTHEGTAVIVNSLFEGNHGRLGAGINNLLTNLTVVNTTFTGNTTNSLNVGGAIYVDGALRGQNSGFVNVCGSLFRQNSGTDGGGIYWCGYTDATYSSDDRLTVDKSEFVDNTAKNGAGILSTCNGKALISNSTFSGNTSADMGGGICSYKDNLDVVNSTFVGNVATNIQGGGIHSNGIANLRNVTLTGNTATHGGGVSGDKLRAYNSIIAANTATNPWNIHHNCTNPMTAASGLVVFPDRVGNLSDPNNRPCAATPKIADPKLDALKNNGGPTRTAGLLAGSGALGAGTGCEAKDQRGVSRGTTCDAGAFEAP